MPWVRPWDSWPPWVFSGITPSRAMALPPSRKSLASPMPQKPSASSQDRQLKLNPSYSSATSTSLGRNDVRVHRCADWPSTCGSWVSVVWSQSVRSMIWVPTASNSTGCLGHVLGDVDGRHDHRDRAVARDVAVVEPERSGDHPGVQVVVHGHRIAVDGRRIECRVCALVQRDPAERLPRGAVPVEVPLCVQRQHVRRRRRAERHLPAGGAGAPGRGHLAFLHQLLERCLPQRAEAQHVAGHAGGDGHHRRDHRAAGTEGVHAAVDPRRTNSQCALQRGHAAFAHAGDVEARVGGQPVDVVECQAGVGDRGLARLDGQRQRRNHQPAAEPRRADAGDRRAVLELLSGQRRPHVAAEILRCDLVDRRCGPGFFSAVGRKSGSQTSVDLLERDLDGLARARARRGRIRRCWWSTEPGDPRRRRPGPPRRAAGGRGSRSGG